MKHLLITAVLAATSAHAASIFVAPVPGTDEGSSALTRAVETAVLKKIVDADVVTPRALDTKLEMDLVQACNGEGDDAACVVDFAQGMGVDYVVRTTVAKLGDTRIMTMSIYHGHRAALLGQGQRKADRVEQLVDEVPGLVVEVAKAAELRTVVENVKSPPYIAYSELGGGALVLLGSAAVHAVSFGVVEPDYEKAQLSRTDARTWEFARPFAYVGPVAGYLVGAGLLGLGVFTLTREGP